MGTSPDRGGFWQHRKVRRVLLVGLALLLAGLAVYVNVLGPEAGWLQIVFWALSGIFGGWGFLEAAGAKLSRRAAPDTCSPYASDRALHGEPPPQA